MSPAPSAPGGPGRVGGAGGPHAAFVRPSPRCRGPGADSRRPVRGMSLIGTSSYATVLSVSATSSAAPGSVSTRADIAGYILFAVVVIAIRRFHLLPLASVPRENRGAGAGGPAGPGGPAGTGGRRRLAGPASGRLRPAAATPSRGLTGQTAGWNRPDAAFGSSEPTSFSS